MVAQLLQDETIPLKDREAYEQNIKDCATSGFIGETGGCYLRPRLLTSLSFRSDPQSWQ